MRALVADQLGPPQDYTVIEAPDPTPGPGQLLVAVQACGLGYVDALIAAGGYQVRPDPPYCPGLEFCGEVVAHGPGVTEPAIGTRVAASTFGGGLAELACVDARAAIVLPEDFPAELAAGFIVNYCTAWHALIDRAALRAGETVLVLGAAGGTGIAAVQVAALAGARVIAGASTDEKRDFALRHGAHECLDYTQADWRGELKAMTKGRGVDVVFDPVGGDLLEPAFRSLAWRGRHLVIGFVGGAIPALPVNLALLKGASLVGVDYRQFGMVHEVAAADRVRDALFDAVQRGALKPPTGRVFALAQAAEALAHAGVRDGVGKTIVRLRD